MSENKLIEIGKIVGTYGINGELKIYPWCDELNEIVNAKRLYLEKKEINLINRKAYKSIVLAKAEGINSPEEAKAFLGKIIYIPREDIKLKNGQYLIIDLIGLQIVDNQDENIVYGKVKDVIKTGSNDVYVIKDDKSKEYLIPVIKSVVNSVDINSGKIRITPMKGLFDDEN